MRWKIGNLYGKIFGYPWLSSYHHAVINLSLHALGYGNILFNSSGEEWFIDNKLKSAKPNTVLDIGANVGTYTQMILNKTDARVIAVEPNPSSFKKLQNNIDPNRVISLQCAVANEPGKAELYFRSDLDEKASLAASRADQQSTTVSVKTIAQIIHEQNVFGGVDFIKIDTEGFEKEVLQGLGELRPAFIQFEFNINHLQRHTTLLEIVELLPEYDLYRLLPNGWLKVNPNKYLNNIFMFSNYVAVKK
jgi:FkbM family methyltransferase